jgi:hypothetical protein
MADTTTTNVSLTKPEVGASADSWGTKINTNFDTLDNLFTTGPALLITKGGTGATTASGARTALGLGTVAVESTVPVAKGGTGSTTLTANNVLLGNGTSALQVVAPSTSGNVLTSDGTTWTSAALPSGGVTSIAAGNGIAVSASTGAVTVSQNIYTGTSDANTSYPIGSYVVGTIGACCSTNQNATLSPRVYESRISYVNGSSFLAGTWRIRGFTGGNQHMTQRVA